jgi:hypothetical protein
MPEHTIGDISKRFSFVEAIIATIVACGGKKNRFTDWRAYEFLKNTMEAWPNVLYLDRSFKNSVYDVSSFDKFEPEFRKQITGVKMRKRDSKFPGVITDKYETFIRPDMENIPDVSTKARYIYIASNINATYFQEMKTMYEEPFKFNRVHLVPKKLTDIGLSTLFVNDRSGLGIINHKGD